MRGSMRAPKASVVAIIGAFFAFSSLPAARAQAPGGTIADGDSIFIDGQALRITPGKARPNSAGELSALGSRDLGAGAIIYRLGERLYIVDGPAGAERGGPRGPVSPVVDPDRARPGQIRVQYDPPRDPEHLKLYQILMKHSVLEKVQGDAQPVQRLPKTLVIKTLGCDGLINSWYNEDEGVPTVRMCYELLHTEYHYDDDRSRMSGRMVTRHDAITGQFLFLDLAPETGLLPV